MDKFNRFRCVGVKHLFTFITCLCNWISREVRKPSSREIVYFLSGISIKGLKCSRKQTKRASSANWAILLPSVMSNKTKYFLQYFSFWTDRVNLRYFCFCFYSIWCMYILTYTLQEIKLYEIQNNYFNNKTLTVSTINN